MTELSWRCLHEAPGSSGFLRVHTRRYLTPDGQTSTWDILVGGPTVAVVAVTDDASVVLVRQFRPGPGCVLLELPGGGINDGEDALVAAARELREETGYEADDLTLVGRTWLASYSSTERYAVLAQGCRQTASPKPDLHEHLEAVLLTYDEFIAHLRTGDLTDADIAYMCVDRLHT